MDANFDLNWTQIYSMDQTSPFGFEVSPDGSF
jgi:hypothetical protein